MSDYSIQGPSACAEIQRVAVWSPYKPLEYELRKLIRLLGGVESSCDLAGRNLPQEMRDAGATVAIVNVDHSSSGTAELIGQIRREAPGIKVIALSAHRDRRMISNALESGAIGYVLTDCAFEDVPHALRAAARNERFISPAIEGIEWPPVALLAAAVNAGNHNT